MCAVIRQSDGRQIWEGQRWSRTYTHRNTHTHTLAQLLPIEQIQIQHYAKVINAEKDYSTRIFTINV